MGDAIDGETTLPDDDVVVTSNTTGQTARAPAGGLVTGDRPPLIPPAWWPWIIFGVVGGAVWWFVAQSKREGRGDAGPLAG